MQIRVQLEFLPIALHSQVVPFLEINRKKNKKRNKKKNRKKNRQVIKITLEPVSMLCLATAKAI